MKDATIGDHPTAQSGAVVDTDDIIFQLGKDVVDNLNLRKIIDKLKVQLDLMLKKAQAAEQVLLKNKELQDSNAKYSENNKRLDSYILELNVRIKTLDTLIGDYKSKFDQVEQELETQKDTTDAFAKSNDEMGEIIKKKDAYIDKLKAQIKNLKAKNGKHTTSKTGSGRELTDA